MVQASPGNDGDNKRLRLRDRKVCRNNPCTARYLPVEYASVKVAGILIKPLDRNTRGVTGSLKGDDRVWSITGAANKYETFGADKIFRCLKENGIRISHVVKDGDNKMVDTVRTYYPAI